MGRRKKQTNEKFGVIDDKKPIAPPVAPKPDTTMKDYMDILRYQTKQRNGLLGGFSVNGKYSIRNKEILEHLLSTPKKFEEKIDDTVYVSAKKGDFVINFKIDFDISPDYCTAKLYLIEVEHGIEKDIKHVTELDNFVAPYSATFNEEVYKQWKVWKDTPVYKKDDFLFEILAMMKEEYLFNKELTDLLSQLYMTKMLEFLGKCGELGEKTRADYQRLVDRMLKNDPSISQDFARLKLILDEVIKKNNLYKEIEKTEEGKKLLNGYAQPLKKFKETATVMELIRPKQQEKAPVQEPEKTAFDKKVEKVKETVKPTTKSPADYTLTPVKGDSLAQTADLFKDMIYMIPGVGLVAQAVEVAKTVTETLEIGDEGKKLQQVQDVIKGVFRGGEPPKEQDKAGDNDKTPVTILENGKSVTFEVPDSVVPDSFKSNDDPMNRFKNNGYNSKDGKIKNMENFLGGVANLSDGNIPPKQQEEKGKTMDQFTI